MRWGCVVDRATLGSGITAKGSRGMKIVGKDHVVQVHYTGTLGNGEVFDSSQGREPLEVTIGQGQLITGFENALLGMAVNEKKKFTLTPEEAYGPRYAEAMQQIPRTEIPPEIDIQIGQVVALSNSEGLEMPARVVLLEEDQVTLDMNHPLAGESLTFDIEVVGIADEPR